MSTKIVVAATVAVFGLAATHATAEAGEGNGDPFPFKAPSPLVVVTYTPWARDTGSVQYPPINPALSTPSLAQPTLPGNGQNGAVETANSLPLNAMVGTPTYAQAQTTERWLAQTGDRPSQPGPAMAQADTPTMRQTSAADRPADLDVQHNFDGYTPNSRVVVQIRMHKHNPRIAHPRIFAHAPSHRYYAAETPVHIRHHEYSRRLSRTAFRYDRHPAAVYADMPDATREASQHAVASTPWWDDLP